MSRPMVGAGGNAGQSAGDGLGKDDGDAVMGDTHTAHKELCVECGDQQASLFCDQCQDDYCQLCYQAMHRRGKRKMHVARNKHNEPLQQVSNKSSKDKDLGEKDGLSQLKEYDTSENEDESGTDSEEENEEDTRRSQRYNGVSVMQEVQDGKWFTERARYIPLRLTWTERKVLRLLEAALNASDYTDKVDKVDMVDPNNNNKRTVQQLKEICAVLCGLMVACDYKTGLTLVSERSFSEHAEFFQDIFEIGRRHKIMNPEKMRSEYGKLVYLLQDSKLPEIQDLIKFSMIRPVRTVHSFLSERNCAQMLNDPLLQVATHEIIPDGKTRPQIQREIKEKEYAIKVLARKYSSANIKSEEIERCIYSIGDNHSFLRSTRDTIDKMLQYLRAYFSPDKVDDGYSLAIAAGVEGSRLTHSHARQYRYVQQSMALWREVAHDMFRLWVLAEEDLLGDDLHCRYQLKDTGQGHHRVQQSPRTLRAMQFIVRKAQSFVGADNWVGSSVVHVGDKNVPNALMFIDKYTQVSRILNPIELCLRKADELLNVPTLRDYIDRKFGGMEMCKRDILCDFFRHGFDGSGADNFFDAGSCIDGRLTSAWHWCSQIDKKPYYPIFLLTGFVGFDGQF